MSAPVSDPTFRSYSSKQAKLYASHRLSYSAAIYDNILTHHQNTGGKFDFLVDTGCGPGNATRDLARSFDRAIGVDAGPAMIETATALGGKTKSGVEIKYEVMPAETFSHADGIELGTVDMVTAAMASHWYDMAKFYVEAARVLKPGGTLALFTCSSNFCHSFSGTFSLSIDPDTPNAAEVMKTLLKFERETLAPYELLLNRLSMNMYDDMILPWNLSTPLVDFPQALFTRQTWDRDGVLSDGKDFFCGSREESLESIEAGLGTASMVTRWREAHPEDVGTDKDVVRSFCNELRGVLGPDTKTLVRGSGTAILMFKKK